MEKEDRIKLRDEIFELLKTYSFLITTRANNWRFIVKNEEFKDKLNKDKKLKELYDLYIKQFRTEDEAIYNILHHDDYLNHLCETCNGLCKFYDRNKGYRESCENKKCRANLRNVKKINKKVKETEKRKNNKDEEIIINIPIKLIKISSNERIKLRDELLDEYNKKSLYNFIVKTFKKILNKNYNLMQKYNLYVHQFETEGEALYCLRNKDDPSNHLCPICKKISKFYNMRHGYRETCGDNNCIKTFSKTEEAEEKRKNSNIKRYNHPSAMQCDRIKKKVKQTKKERYGDSNFNNREKAEQTCLKKYNSRNPFQVKKFKDKIKQTLLKKYGVTHPSKCKKIVSKIRYTWAKKNSYISDDINKIVETLRQYINVDVTNSDDFMANIYSKDEYFIRSVKILYNKFNRKLRLNEYGKIFHVDGQTIRIRIDKLGLSDYFYIHDSLLEIQFKDFLINNKIDFKRHNKDILPKSENDGRPEIDFILNNNIAFEINDICSHNCVCKDQSYHLNKTLECKKKNIRLIHLWEWELTNEELWHRTSNWILNLLNQSKIQLDVKDCSIREVPVEEQKHFLNKYNLYGYQQSDICLGLYHNNELIELISFRDIKHDEFQLLQYCCDPSYRSNIKLLLNHFIERHNPSSIITKCDFSKFTRKTFEELGFKLINHNAPNKISFNKNEESEYKILYDCGTNFYKIEFKNF